MDIIIPDTKTYSDFEDGKEISAYAIVHPSHDEYKQIIEGCELNVFPPTTKNISIKANVVRREGPLPSTPNGKHEIHRLTIRKV